MYTYTLNNKFKKFLCQSALKLSWKGFFGVFWGLYRTFRFLTCSNKVACSFSVFIFIVYIFPPVIILLIQIYDFKTLWYFENWNFTCRHFCLSYIGWVHFNCIFHLLLISKLCVCITLNCKVGKPYIQLASNVKYVHLSEFIDKVKISRWTGRNLKEKFL